MDRFFKILMIAGLMVAMPITVNTIDNASHSIPLVVSKCYAAGKGGIAWIPGMPTFNALRCKKCGYNEFIGPGLAYSVGKAWYYRYKPRSSGISFSIEKLMENFADYVKISVDSMYDFFMKDRRSIGNKTIRKIRNWLNDTYRCSACGAGDWEYVMIEKWRQRLLSVIGACCGKEFKTAGWALLFNEDLLL